MPTYNRATENQCRAIHNMSRLVDFHQLGQPFRFPKTSIVLTLILKENAFSERAVTILCDNLSSQQASSVIDALKRDSDDEAFSVLAERVKLRYPDIIEKLAQKKF